MKGEDVKDLFIVGIDIAQYSLKPLESQKEAQLVIDNALNDAVRNGAPAKREKPEWLDGGDGGYALFEWNSGREVLEVIKIFTEALKRRNLGSLPDHTVSVRVALHHGKVLCWKGQRGKRFTSHAINECARLLAALSRDPGRVACSGEFLEKITGLDDVAQPIRLKDVVDKHGISHEFYNLQQDPGFGIAPKSSDRHENPFV
ncbi:MAG TPA: hypothetical protein VGO55_17225 [Allosphingosinicella sp.]|nr:hypothetical protein [Allosphingosinicella sp.]